MTSLLRFLLLLVVGTSVLPSAQGTERIGDAVLLSALRERTPTMNAIERDALALIESSPEEDRFELYRTYDRLMGAWVQVSLSRQLLELSISAVSPSEEREIRTTLRDQAEFALWDLDQARIELESNVPDASRQDHLRVNEAIRSLLLETRAIISHMVAAQCFHLQCAAGP